MSLAVVFVIGFLGLGMMTTISTIALSEINKNINTKSGSMSFYTAEAATREGAYRYINGYNHLTGTSSYTGGTSTLNFTAGTTTVNILAWPKVEIKSIAQNNLTQREIIYTLTKFPEGLAFDYAIYSESDIELSGNASTSGNIFSNGSTTLSGSATVDGNVSSVGNVTGTIDHIDGSISTNVIPIPAPNIILNSYEPGATCFATTAAAALNCVPNTSLSGNIFASTTDLINNLGGNLTDLTGNIVAKGDLTINGGVYTTATDTSIVIGVGGTLHIKGGTTINGIVYVEGATIMDGGGHEIAINGALISKGGITDLGGHAKISYDKNLVENWAHINGLSTTTSTGPPRITGWQEQ